MVLKCCALLTLLELVSVIPLSVAVKYTLQLSVCLHVAPFLPPNDVLQA